MITMIEKNIAIIQHYIKQLISIFLSIFYLNIQNDYYCCDTIFYVSIYKSISYQNYIERMEEQ